MSGDNIYITNKNMVTCPRQYTRQISVNIGAGINNILLYFTASAFTECDTEMEMFSQSQ